LADILFSNRTDINTSGWRVSYFRIRAGNNQRHHTAASIFTFHFPFSILLFRPSPKRKKATSPVAFSCCIADWTTLPNQLSPLSRESFCVLLKKISATFEFTLVLSDFQILGLSHLQYHLLNDFSTALFGFDMIALSDIY
jgi:hypothetical protein